MINEEWDGSDGIEDMEERRVFLAALDSFYQYAKTAHFNTTHLRRQSFYALPRAHWEMLAAPPFSFLDTLNAVDDAIDHNAELALAVLHAGLQSLGLPPVSLATKTEDHGIEREGPGATSEWRGQATAGDLEKARSTLRQFYRDWSREGAAEREASYGRVRAAIQQEAGLRQRVQTEHKADMTSPSSMSLTSSTIDRQLRVLIPGAGLARLVFELACDGFETEGNEISYHQLLASSYILNTVSGADVHTLYPWVHSFSNHRDRSRHLQAVRIPDIHPGTELARSSAPTGAMSMSASDFLCLYGEEHHRQTFDVVAAVFFLDTAPNLIRYLEAIHNCLRPNGLLINFGPLLWHFENNAPGTHGRASDSSSSGRTTDGIADPGSVELTEDEVVALVDRLGFDIERHETGIAAPYIQDPESMLQNEYRASFWVARKRA